MRLRFVSLTASLFLAFGSAGLVQTPTGTLQGAVTDQSGGPVLGATVRVANTNTNEAKEFKTDAGGRYVIPFLGPGTYTVSVKAAGFRESRESGVKIDVGQVRSIDFSLQVGQVSEQIEVEAGATPLDVNNSTLGALIDNRKVVDLPLNGRNPFALAELTQESTISAWLRRRIWAAPATRSMKSS